MQLRRSGAAMVAVLFACTQFLFPLRLWAQVAPPASTPSAPTHTISTNTTGTISATPPPSGSLTAAPLPTKGVITASLASTLSNAITSSGTVVIDFGKLAGGTLNYGTSNFTNHGSIYAVSSNPNVHTATISANNIFNQQGSTITTVIPQGGLPGYSNLVSGLNLVLNAIQSVVNAGTISSAGNLTVNAGTSIINALPSTALASTPPPVMQAANNLNLTSPSIINAGTMASLASNINISSQTAQSININNVGGTLSALQGMINVRDSSFAGKYDFSLLGGDVLAKQLNIYSGNGLLDLQVDNLNPVLNVYAGDAYISANSNINIGNLTFTGDPIINSGNDIVFASDKDPVTGQPNGHCTGGGIFSGTNVYIADNVTDINISGAIITLTGAATLSRLPINVASSLAINAVGNINTSDVGAGSAIILSSSNGNITTGNLAAGSNAILIAPKGSITAGTVRSALGVNMDAGQQVHATSVTTTAGGSIDIENNLLGGATGLTLGVGGNIGVIQDFGYSYTRQSWIYLVDGGAGGITLTSPNNIAVSTPYTFTQVALDARAGNINLPSGTMSVDSNNFYSPAGAWVMSANAINANGTTLSASNTAGGYAGFISLGANNINIGNGLTLNTNGLVGGIGVSGTGSVTFTQGYSPTFVGFPYAMNYLGTSYDGGTNKSFAVNGPGNLNINANGGYANVFVDGGNIAFNNAGSTTISVNGGNYYTAAGYAEVWGNAVSSASQQAVQITANGFGNGRGGFVHVEADAGDLALGSGAAQIDVVENGGKGNPTQGLMGGAGGTAVLVASNNLTISGGGVSVAAGMNGAGGYVYAQSGSNLTVNGAISADGNGSGYGGTVWLNGATSGTGSVATNANISAQGASQSGLVHVAAFGAASITDNGGTLEAGTVQLQAQSGSIGTSTAPVNTATNGALSASSGGGSVYISQAGNANLTGSSAAQTFQLTDLGNLTIKDDITATSVSLTAKEPAGGTGNIYVGLAPSPALNGAITASQAVNLVADDNVQVNAQIQAPTINISTTGVGTGNVYVRNAITGTNSVSITTGGGGNIIEDGPPFAISGNNVTLSAGGSIGQRMGLGTNEQVQNVVTKANILSLTGGNNIYVSQLGDVLLKNAVGSSILSNVGDPFEIRLDVTGSMAFAASGTGNVSSSHVVITTHGGSVDLGGGHIVANGPTGLSISADRAITQSVAIGSLDAPVISLKSSSSDIGTATNPIFIAGTMGLIANAPNGSIFVSQSGTPTTVVPGTPLTIGQGGMW